jgi:hypothetical protein
MALSDLYLVLKFTRHWIHYGWLAHMGICTLVAGFLGIFGQ